MKNIILVDSFATGSFHEMFDAAFLMTVLENYDYVDYYISKSSIINQKNIIGNKYWERVRYHTLWQIEDNNTAKLFFKYVLSALYYVYFALVKRDSSIVFLNNNPFVSFIYPIVKSPLNIVCHGELELLVGEHSGKFERLESKILKRTFIKKIVPDNLNFIVLGQIIKDNIQTIINPQNIERFRCIDHPYIFENITEKNIMKKGPIKLGIVGLTNKSKGLATLRALLNNGNKDVQIVHIGQINDYDGFLKKNGLIIVERDNNNELSRDSYSRYIDEMDYLLFLYPQNNYKITASGAIFESLSKIKPVIGIRTDFFDYINKKVGGIGVLVNDEEEMLSFIRKLSIDDRNNISKYSKVLREGRIYFTPEFQSKFLEKALIN